MTTLTIPATTINIDIDTIDCTDFSLVYNEDHHTLCAYFWIDDAYYFCAEDFSYDQTEKITKLISNLEIEFSDECGHPIDPEENPEDFYWFIREFNDIEKAQICFTIAKKYPQYIKKG